MFERIFFSLSLCFLGFLWVLSCQPPAPTDVCDSCKDDEICDLIQKTCVPKKQACSPCRSDGDCENGQFCDTDRCCKKRAAKPEILPDATPESPADQPPPEPRPEPRPAGSYGTPCEIQSDCQSGLRCEDTKKTCSICLRDEVCPKDKPRCIGGIGLCVECFADTDCSAQQKLCDTKTNACYAPCSCPSGKKCDDRGLCVAVCEGVTCTPEQICNPTTGVCEKRPSTFCDPKKGCAKTSDCCNEDGSCSPCGTTALCGSCTKAADCGRGNACHKMANASLVCTQNCTTSTCPGDLECKDLPLFGKQCVPPAAATACKIDPCASRQCFGSQVCCPATGQCHDCCKDGDCLSGKCDLTNRTCFPLECVPACSASQKCCRIAGDFFCRNCCTNADCSAGGSCVGGSCQ